MSKTFYNRFNTPYKVVEYIDGSHVIVEFQDKYKTRVKTVLDAAKNGKVKNPYDKSVFDVGYLGTGQYITRINNKHTKAYDAWGSMLRRCYVEKYADDSSAYYGICSVCDEWHNYQIFAKWYEENKYECDGRLHVDKDILYKGNKIYSPYTCLLVPQRINLIFMTKKKEKDIELPTGVSKSSCLDGTYSYHSMYNGKTIGTYDTIEQAKNKYLEKKREHICRVANEYKNIVSEDVYVALMNW